MASTKMFRDRVVSMEQTYEQGEKHLTLLQAIIVEALPELEFRAYQLDHEHDLFVMIYGAPGGGECRITWTRMVLYDAERIPAILDGKDPGLRGRIVDYIRKRSGRPVIDITFRHLEEGWVDTPEPRKPKPKQKPAAPGAPQGRPPQAQRGVQNAPSPGGSSQEARRGGAGGGRPAPANAPPSAAAESPGNKPAGGRRRFRRRRGRRRGGGGGTPGTPGGGAGGASS